MRIAALTSGRTNPSARFRVRQHIPLLREAGMEVSEYCPAVLQGARLPGTLGRVRVRYLPPLVAGQIMLNLALRAPGIVGSYRADVTWLERNFVPGLDDAAVLLGKPLVLDIDDAIWLYNPLGKSQVARLARRADMVFAGNRFIADWCSQFCRNIRVVPTAVDASRFVPRPMGKEPDAPFVVGWTGTSGNFPYLKAIESALDPFLRRHPSAQVMVIADRAPRELSLPAGQLVFHPWTPDTEHLLLQEFDVGIMPLDDSDLSRGKCSYKLLQYMAAGLPVIASPYGMNAEVLMCADIGYAATTASDWLEALETCKASPARIRAQGATGRRVLLEKYSLPVVSSLLRSGFEDALNSVAGG